MAFEPVSIDLHEAGPNDPYRWTMTEPLCWRGVFRGRERELEVPASFEKPFVTDLASVPRSLTWLFPRYGKYTKAAVLHDFLCQNFRDAGTTPQSLLPLQDRSDADEMFRVVMGELKVPLLRRWLMWSAVSWATLFTSLVPGRRSRTVARWTGRVLAVASVVAAFVTLLGGGGDWWLRMGAAVGIVVVGVLLAGFVALGRPDRAASCAWMLVLTVFFSGLLLAGVLLIPLLWSYLFVEDAVAGFPWLRGRWRELTSREEKLKLLGSPQFARIAAVIQS